MAIVKKNDPKAVEKKTTKEPKPERNMNDVWAERITRNTEKQEILLTKNPSIYADTGSRFRPGSGRQTAFELAKNILKKKQKPMELDVFFNSFSEAAPEEIKKDGNYGPFVIGTHLDVFLVQEGTILLNPIPPEAVERPSDQKPTPAERALVKAAKAEEKAAAKAAAAQAVTAPAKKAVMLKKKPAASPVTA